MTIDQCSVKRLILGVVMLQVQLLAEPNHNASSEENKCFYEHYVHDIADVFV